MGMVVVLSLPLIVFSLALGFGCYYWGRAKGRQDVRTNAQVYGLPTPPPGASSSFPSSPTPSHFSKPPPNAANLV